MGGFGRRSRGSVQSLVIGSFRSDGAKGVGTSDLEGVLGNLRENPVEFGIARL